MKKPALWALRAFGMRDLVLRCHDLHLPDDGSPRGDHLVMAAGHSYYRLLCWLSNQFAGKTIVEVGTFRGIGSLCLSRNPDTTVRTYDIRTYDFMADQPPNQTRVILNGEYPDISDAACIFYDASHNGVDEACFLAHCQAAGWHGPIFWDDIHISEPRYEAMRKWWQELTIPKEDWTDIGHCTGTGLTLL